MLQPITFSHAENYSVTISTNNMNVRTGPGLSYQVVTKVQKGDHFSLLMEEGDWYQIDLGSGEKGWVANWLVDKSQNRSPSKTIATSGTIQTNNLRVRSGPGTSFSVIGSLNKGETVQILNQDENWYKIKGPFGNGWVSKEYVQSTSEGVPNSVPSSGATKSGQITGNSLNVRSKPSTESRAIGKLNKGDQVIIHDEKNGWVQITFEDQLAWVSSDFVRKENRKKTKEANPSSATGTITATALNVRDSNTLNGKVIGRVSKGETFKILEEDNNWIKIELNSDTYGWVAGWYVERTMPKEDATVVEGFKERTITIMRNGTNVRKGPDLSSQVVQRVHSGETFSVLNVQNDWYEIKLSNGTKGFVAGWIVSGDGGVPQAGKQSSKSLKNATIMIDPGHGGRDNGTTGSQGTLEKKMTLETSQLLYNKLKATGANVILTRNNDFYVSLSSRVSLSHYHNVDAYISIHYDSSENPSAKGMTTYYYNSNDKSLASNIHLATQSQTKLKSRGVRFGDYHVIRENKQNAALLELGYLSNPTEEFILNSDSFQERVTTGIVQGLTNYFRDN